MLSRILVLAVVLQLTWSQQYQQKVAPGVPPQNYQNYQQPPPPPPPQNIPQHQQQQQQYQQVPQQQYQQVPQQQYQQQVPVQQVPVQQVQPPQGHGGHGHDPNLLNPNNMEHEKEHIKEHMDVPLDVSKMSQAELQFHYFKMHDADNNNKLDGCELIKSLIHWHAEQGHKQQQQQQPGAAPVGDKIFSDDELVNLIDPILNMDDLNKDGYIDYPEFVRAQQKSQQQEGQK